MNPFSDLNLRVLQFAVAAVAATLAAFLVTDAQFTSVFSLNAQDLGNASLLLGRLRFLFRLTLLLLLAFLVLAVFLLVRRFLFRDAERAHSGTGIEVVTVEDGIRDAIDEVSRNRKAQTLRLWGYSLQWASRLSLHLEANPQSQLSVEVFVPDSRLIGDLFDDPKALERAAVLRLRLEEWRALANSRRVKSVEVYAQPTIPNDLGLMVDQSFALVHSYDWSVDGSRVTHVRQPSDRRRFLRVRGAGTAGSYLLEQLGTRLLCRRYDSVST